jgi:class 3 adenylate cyclase/tetratricopeptide (TPR) repeat protein
MARARRAILFSDVVESVRLIEEDEAGFLNRWLPLVERVKSQVLPDFGGRLIKSLGDGLLIDFSNVRSAVSAAFAIRELADGANGAVAPRARIRLRTGIEVSDVVVVDEHDIYGRGVNRAARLVSLAGPGQVVVSAAVRDAITADLDADIEDLGDCYLKHLAEPVRAYRIRPPGPVAAQEASASPEDLLPSLAIVPFSSREADEAHQVIGEIIAEELIRDLSHSAELTLISRMSTTAFRNRGIAPDLIGANLKADYVLSGFYAIRDQAITIDAELAETKSGQIIWAKRQKGRIGGLLGDRREMMDRLAADVTQAIMKRALQRAQLQAVPTLTNYTLLLAAMGLMHRLSRSDFEAAKKLLDELVERGRRQAIPQAWLANWHVLRVQQGWSDDPDRDGQLALQSTKQALDSDPQCALALAVDGFVHTNLLKRLDVSQERYELAIRHNPNDPRAWSLKGTLHAFRGEGALAMACTRRALRLSPLDPQRWFYESLAASACIAAGQYDGALQHARRSLRANRNHTSTLRVMAVAQWQLGEHAAARATAQDLLRLDPGMTVSGWLARAPSAAFAVGQDFASVLKKTGIPY